MLRWVDIMPHTSGPCALTHSTHASIAIVDLDTLTRRGRSETRNRALIAELMRKYVQSDCAM
jgi:hypothetical protein